MSREGEKMSEGTEFLTLANRERGEKREKDREPVEPKGRKARGRIAC